MMKINNFQGDLTDVSRKKQPLLSAYSLTRGALALATDPLTTHRLGHPKNYLFMYYYTYLQDQRIRKQQFI